MESLIQILQSSFAVLLGNAVVFIPNAVMAIVLLWIGWIVGISFEKVLSRIIHMLRFDWYLERFGLGKILSRSGFKLDSGAFVGALAKWFIVVAFLVAALHIVGLASVGVFLVQVVLYYIPQVITAAIILFFAAVGAHATKQFISGSVKALGVNTANLLGNLANISIWLITIILILSQLGIAADFMKILFIGIIFMISLAGGLAFGIGGKDEAAILLSKMHKDASNRS